MHLTINILKLYTMIYVSIICNGGISKYAECFSVKATDIEGCLYAKAFGVFRDTAVTNYRYVNHRVKF